MIDSDSHKSKVGGVLSESGGDKWYFSLLRVDITKNRNWVKHMFPGRAVTDCSVL